MWLQLCAGSRKVPVESSPVVCIEVSSVSIRSNVFICIATIVSSLSLISWSDRIQITKLKYVKLTLTHCSE